MDRTFPKTSLALLLLIIAPLVHAGLFDKLKEIGSEVLKPNSTTSESAGLSESEIIAGLKQALDIGSQKAIQQLSQQGGFLDHADVRIPIPDAVQPVAKSLRYLGQDALVEQFQTTLNRAAEQATPKAAQIFSDAISQMTLQDANKILNGPDNAATEYFREKSTPQLIDSLLPIVRQATDSAGVTASYKQLIGGVKNMSSLIPQQSLDLDQFVTEKAVEGMFTRIAVEEKAIRENPAQRTTDLLKKVFSQ